MEAGGGRQGVPSASGASESSESDPKMSRSAKRVCCGGRICGGVSARASAPANAGYAHVGHGVLVRVFVNKELWRKDLRC